MAIKTAAQLTAENAANFADNTIGAITPALLRAFEQDMIDTAVGIMPSQTSLASILVDFSVAGDNQIPISLPAWATRFLVNSVRLDNASGNLSAATAGLFTQAGGAGVAPVAGGTAITVVTAAENTNNNTQNFAITNAGTQSYAIASVPIMFFRVAATVAQTGKVTLGIIPLP